MMKISRGYFYACVCFLILIFICFSCPVYAANGDILFEDDFTTKTKVDFSKTTAIVDIIKAEVRLPKITGNQSFDVFDDAMIVQNGNLIELYERGSDGKYKKITEYTDEEAIAITFSSQGYAHYILKNNNIAYKMEYGSGSFIENPVYKLSGLRSAVTIAASEEKVFIGETNSIQRYEEKDTVLEQMEKIDANFNISQIATGPNQEIVVSGENAIHVFRMSGTGYVESPTELLSGADYADYGDEDEIVATTGDNIKIFKMSGEILNINHAGIVAVKALPGLVYVRDGESITEYAFDGTKMVAVNKLSGLNLVKKYYLSPRIYQSKLFKFNDPCKRFRVMASLDIPDTTSVSFSISTNGTDFYYAKDGLFQLPEKVNQLILRAELSSGKSKETTPKIFDVKVLDSTLSIEKMETTEIIRDPGGNPLLPTELPVKVMGGYNFYIRVLAPGASQVWIQFSNGEKAVLTEQSPYIFIGSHYFPHDIALGTIISAEVFARDEFDNQVSKNFKNHFFIADNIEVNLNVFDTK